MAFRDFETRFAQVCVQAWGDGRIDVDLIYADVPYRIAVHEPNPVTGTSVHVYPMRSFDNTIVALGRRNLPPSGEQTAIEDVLLGNFIRRSPDLLTAVRRTMEFLADCQGIEPIVVQVSETNAAAYGELIRARGHEHDYAKVLRWAGSGDEGKGLVVDQYPRAVAFVSAVGVDDDTAIIGVGPS